MTKNYVATAGAVALPDTIRKTLANTFWTVGGMLGITAVASFLALGMQMSLAMSLVLFVASIAMIFAVHFFRNSPVGLVLLAGFSALMGVSMGPVINSYLGMPNGGSMVGLAAGLTSLATFGCATYAITTRKDFSRWGAFLFAGLLVLIVASVVGIFVSTPALHLTIAAVGSLLFLGWLLYDVSNIVNGHETNYISASLGIYLDIINLFLHLLRLLSLLPSDD